MNSKPIREENILSKFTAKKPLPPTAVLRVPAPVSFCHSDWAAIPFILQSAITRWKSALVIHCQYKESN